MSELLVGRTQQVMSNENNETLVRWWNDNDGGIVWQSELERELKKRGFVTRRNHKRVIL